MDDATERGGPALIGNGLALAGAILYLLEWVAIFAFSPPGPLGPDKSPGQLVTAYADHAGRAAASAGWFAFVLVGRVLFIAGLKAGLRRRPRELPLLDLALGAMAIGVALEVIGYGLGAAAARLAADGADPGLVSAVDAGGYWLVLLLFAPTGVAILAASIAMLRSRLFATWLCVVGLIAGVGAVAGGLLAGLAAEDKVGVVDGVSSVGAIGMWVWMIGTGVVLLRARQPDRAIVA